MAEDVRRVVERQRLMSERGELRNTTTIAELLGIFDPDDVRALAAYQLAHADTPTTLLDSPLHPAFYEKYSQRPNTPGRTHLFTHNRIYFDDPIEDVLEADVVVAALKRNETGRGRTPEEIMDALRARRVAVGFLLELDNLENREQVEPTRLLPPTNIAPNATGAAA